MEKNKYVFAKFFECKVVIEPDTELYHEGVKLDTTNAREYRFCIDPNKEYLEGVIEALTKLKGSKGIKSIILPKF